MRVEGAYEKIHDVWTQVLLSPRGLYWPTYLYLLSETKLGIEKWMEDGGDYKPDDVHAVSFPGSSWSAQHSSQQPRMSDSNAPPPKKKYILLYIYAYMYYS